MSDMATPPSDDTKTMFKLLADGEWHDYNKIKDALAATVSPGRAARKYEERLKSSRLVHGSSPREGTALSEDEQILYGARACAQVALTSWKGRGIIQKIDEGTGRKWIKIKPGFKAWGVNSVGPQNPETPEGRTEVPPGDSEPSEGAPPGAEASAGPSGSMPLLSDADRSKVREFLEPPVAPEPSSPSVKLEDLPGCQECGLLMLDEVMHRGWHERFQPVADAMKAGTAPPEMALFDEKALRTLLGDVMGLELDRFQEGMQSWLNMQFLQLEQSLSGQRQLPERWAAGGNRHSQL